MKKEEFNKTWTNKYPNAILLSYTFKQDYPERWFRIHSLPKSKRYPENDNEWKMLLDRQNTIITDILGENSNVLLVTGEFVNDGELDPIENADSMKIFSLTPLDTIDMHQWNPADYGQDAIYKPLFCTQVWRKGNFDAVLRDIAEDKVSVFFISIEKDIIVAPYDGGIDFILKDSQTRDEYKSKYRDWLSSREDGL